MKLIERHRVAKPQEVIGRAGGWQCGAVEIGGQDYAAAVSLAPGGKIVVAGERNVGGNVDFAVARLHGYVPTFTITRVTDAIEGKQDGVFKIERDGDPYGFDPVGG